MGSNVRALHSELYELREVLDQPSGYQVEVARPDARAGRQVGRGPDARSDARSNARANASTLSLFAPYRGLRTHGFDRHLQARGG